MSLLGSIFGKNNDDNDNDKNNKKSKKKNNNTGLSTLFEKSSKLPERPNHEPHIPPAEVADVANDVKKRSAPDNNNDNDDYEDYQNIKNNNSIKYNNKNNNNNNNNDTSEKKKKKKKKQKTSNGEDDNENNNENKDEQDKKDNDKEKTENETENVENDTENANNNNNANDDNVDERTIFVGNLPIATTTRKSLAAIFKDCGSIVSTRIRSVPVKGIKLPQDRKGDEKLMKKVSVNTKQIDADLKDTVQGYVVFQSKDSIPTALAKNNTLISGGYRIRVDRANHTNPTAEDASKSVFCGNLPYTADESSLQNHFVKGCDLSITDVEGVRIVRDKETFQCKGFGYVLFKDKSMVPLALKLHESMYKNRSIRVQVCGKRTKKKEANKKKNSSSDQPNLPAFIPPPSARAGNNKKQQGGTNNDTTENEKSSALGVFRRILAKQTKEAISNRNKNTKRKRGEKKKSTQKTPSAKASAGNKLSKRAALDKKVDQRVRKLQKRITKGMGKTRRK